MRRLRDWEQAGLIVPSAKRSLTALFCRIEGVIVAPASEALRTRLCREVVELLGVVVGMVICGASHSDCCPGT